MTKYLLFLISLCFSLSAAHAGKIIKGGRIIVSNKNLADISYGPERGQSVKQVLRDYGQPLRKARPVGNPPIIRWYYRDFIVFFEGNHVIQSIINQDKQVISMPARHK